MNTATETTSRKEYHKEHISRTFHLRFGVILLNSKTERYIISRVDTEDYPLVFLREWIDDPFAEGDYYALWGYNALTDTQADEVLDMLKKGETRKARSLFQRYFKDNDPYISDIGPSVLDDMIPEEWYDVWKEMEGIITSTKHITGYWECDVEEKYL